MGVDPGSGAGAMVVPGVGAAPGRDVGLASHVSRGPACDSAVPIGSADLGLKKDRCWVVAGSTDWKRRATPGLSDPVLASRSSLKGSNHGMWKGWGLLDWEVTQAYHPAVAR